MADTKKLTIAELTEATYDLVKDTPGATKESVGIVVRAARDLGWLPGEEPYPDAAADFLAIAYHLIELGADVNMVALMTGSPVGVIGQVVALNESYLELVGAVETEKEAS